MSEEKHTFLKDATWKYDARRYIYTYRRQTMIKGFKDKEAEKIYNTLWNKYREQPHEKLTGKYAKLRNDLRLPIRKQGFHDLKGRHFKKQIPYRVMF